MSEVGFTSSDKILAEAAAKYFRGIYERARMRFREVVIAELGWEPSLHFKANDHLTIIVEASETPYPQILRLRHAEVLSVHMPISVYCMCPEEAYLQESKQPDVNNLRSHGYGLLTADKKGKVTKRFGCIPLIQHLPESEFTTEIKDLPIGTRVRIKEAFESYNQNAGGGVRELTEIMEGLVLDAGKKMASKTWIDKKATQGPLADMLDAMAATPKCRNAAAAIGGARSYMSEYRNPSHHPPRNEREAYTKYRDCLHAFRDGIKTIQKFRSAMKNLGINVTV